MTEPPVPFSRRRLLQAAGAGSLALLVPGIAAARPVRMRAAGTAAPDLVVQWNNALLQGVRDRLGTGLTRAMA